MMDAAEEKGKEDVFGFPPSERRDSCRFDVTEFSASGA
jgi:hypothetical protein